MKCDKYAGVTNVTLVQRYQTHNKKQKEKLEWYTHMNYDVKKKVTISLFLVNNTSI